MSKPAAQGWRLYAAMLRSCVSPKTSAQLAAEFDMPARSVRIITRRLRDAGLLHISAWTEASQRRIPTQLWKFGAGVDAVEPLGKSTGLPSRHPSRRVTRVRPRAKLIAFVSILRAMQEPITLADLAQQTGCSPNRLRQLITYMRSLHLAYVAEWEPRIGVGGAPVAHFKFGLDKRDATKPPRSTSTENSRRFREGRRAKEQTLQIVRALAANSTQFSEAA